MNKLTQSDKGVFQPTLQSFAAESFDQTTTFVDASPSKFIYLIFKYKIKKMDEFFQNADSNLYCGLSPSGAQCGSEQWLFSNVNLLPFVRGTCQNGKDCSTYSNEVCLCPPAANFQTCTCALSAGSATTVSVN